MLWTGPGAPGLLGHLVQGLVEEDSHYPQENVTLQLPVKEAVSVKGYLLGMQPVTPSAAPLVQLTTRQGSASTRLGDKM